MGSRVEQMVISRMGRVLVKSEVWENNHLPLTDAEVALIATSPEDSDMASMQEQREEQNYFV